MSKIVVVGSEEFTLGFELVGIESRPFNDFEKLLDKKEDIGIIVIKKEDYNKLSLKLKNKISTLIKPIVVIISEDDVKGNVLRDKIIRALGVDLLKE
jgi:vacuolar-type H+-ATPase subunit F/Vma7